MASYLRPRRGKKATATSQLTASAPLKRGEIFFEVPDTGVGTGTGKIKMGDGTTAYSSLPYFMEQPTVDYTNAVVAWTNTTAADSDPYSTNATYANNIAPSASLKTIFTNLKKLLMNYNSQLTTLNNDLDGKILYGTNITDILQITKGGLYHSIGDCPNAPTTEGSYYNYFASKHGWLISIIAINCSYKSELYTSLIRTNDGINWNHGGWNKLIDNYTFSDLETKVNNLESKFNNLFTQDGNNLTINY